MKATMTADQSAILQQFLTLPDDPAYADIFEIQAERDDLAEQLEIKTAEFDALQDDLQDEKRERGYVEDRVTELEAALSDAMAWIAADNGGKGLSDFAHDNAEFLRLYKIL